MLHWTIFALVTWSVLMVDRVRGDDHGVGFVEVFGVDEGDLPTGHLPDVVAAFASTPPVAVAGGSRRRCGG
jgi:hypothetical protein